MSLSPKWRHFLQNAQWQISASLILALINLFTFLTSGDTTPWSLIPVFFLSLSLVPRLIDTLFRQDKPKKRKGKGKGKKKSQLTAPAAENSSSSEGSQAVLNLSLQAHLDKAQAYQTHIEALIHSTANESIRKQLQQVSVRLREWTGALEAMAHHINDFQENSLLRQDLETLPEVIETLTNRLAQERDETLRVEMEQTLADRRRQLALLQGLQTRMKRAELKLETTLAAIGAIYSQLLASEATDQVADYSQLSEEVQEEASRLQDFVEALEEVKQNRL